MPQVPARIRGHRSRRPRWPGWPRRRVQHRGRRPGQETSRPTIWRASSCGVVSAVAARKTTLPLRSTVTRSVAAVISASLWLIRMTDGPPLGPPIPQHVEQLGGLGRGEHRGRLVEDQHRGSRRRHLISSTRCRCPADSSLDHGQRVDRAGRSGPRPLRPRRTRRSRSIGAGSPSTTFSQTVSGSIRLKCWCTMPIPSLQRVVGRTVDLDPLAVAQIVPASGWTRPSSTFMSVDLPAPFSPSSPWISPCADGQVHGVAGRRPTRSAS